MITTPSPLLLLLLLLPSLLLPFATAVDTLPANQPMSANQSLVSARGTFKLGFFSPGDPKKRYLAIWYNKIPVLTAVWVANRQSALPDSAGSLVLTANGSLVLTDNTGVVRWSSAGAGTTLGVPVATLLDSGNLVVKDGKGSVVWQSFDYPTDRMLSGMKLGRDLRTGLDRQFTAWAAVGDPTPGPYRMAMDIHGVPQVFLFESSVKKWRSGPWNGERFSGILTMTEYDIFAYKYIVDEDEISYMYEVTDPQIMTHLYVNPIGTVERLVWLDQPSYWHAIQFTMDQCDLFSTCGAFGFCNSNTSPVCNCLQGFKPRSPRDWYLRDGTAGCVRETTLDCHNGTDGFVVVSDVKLPDTSNATVDYQMSLDNCRSTCLANCACTAYSAANISGSVSGCIIWMGELIDTRMYMNRGQDLYVRLAAKDLDSGSSGLHRRTIWIITVASVVLGAIFIGWVGCLLWKQKKRREILATSRCVSENYSTKGSVECEFELPLFEFDTVVAATNYFSFHNKLGEGGFGPVYKGKLDEGQEVAIKRLERSSRQGMDEFKNEVMLIAKLQHRNLVRLFGYCVQGEERLLIYEYMPNGSLDAFLFDKEKGILLDWRTRYEIIMGIARGLTYLHQDSRFRIIHRDLKASNILLDGEMNPKISDFGMARIFGGDETEEKTRRIVGTYGYMSPEYAMDGMFSVKSDVYSFGVLVLEIISGERNRGIYHADEQLKNLVGLTWSLWKEGKSLEIVDKSIQRPFPNVEVLKCIKLGLLCVEERPTDRPTMSSVVFMLGSDGSSLPQPRRPGFAMMRGPKESPSQEEASCGACDSIVTSIECR